MKPSALRSSLRCTGKLQRGLAGSQCAVSAENGRVEPQLREAMHLWNSSQASNQCGTAALHDEPKLIPHILFEVGDECGGNRNLVVLLHVRPRTFDETTHQLGVQCRIEIRRTDVDKDLARYGRGCGRRDDLQPPRET